MNTGNVEDPGHPKVKIVSGATSFYFLFSSYPSSTDFHKNVHNRKWPFTFMEVPRGWIPSRQLCVELRQITTIFLFLFFLPWKMVIAVTWDEGKDTFSTRFHKSEFKEFHYSSWKQAVHIHCLDPLCMVKWSGFPWWNGSLQFLDFFFPLLI